MKIFQIGFNRCGSTSLYKLFLENNVPSIHWGTSSKKPIAVLIENNYLKGRKLLEGIENFVFYSDMESIFNNKYYCSYVSYFKLLDQNYPESKFILNTRNLNNWIKSRKNFVSKLNGNYLKKHMEIFGKNEDEILEDWKNNWLKHHENVQEYFKNKNNLLVFDIEKDNIDKIKKFTCLIKTDFMPHENKSKP